MHVHRGRLNLLSGYWGLTCDAGTFHRPERPEILLFCGSPGAGKSSFYWKYLQPLAYKRVNQDMLKTVRLPQAVCACGRRMSSVE